MWNGKAIAEGWEKNFRIPKEQFDALADEFRPYISPDPSSPRIRLSVEKKMAITLHLLTDSRSITVTADAFGVSASTVSHSLSLSLCGPNSISNPHMVYMGIKLTHHITI